MTTLFLKQKNQDYGRVIQIFGQQNIEVQCISRYNTNVLVCSVNGWNCHNMLRPLLTISTVESERDFINVGDIVLVSLIDSKIIRKYSNKEADELFSRGFIETKCNDVPLSI